jgi:hypothetical protein
MMGVYDKVEGKDGDNNDNEEEVDEELKPAASHENLGDNNAQDVSEKKSEPTKPPYDDFDDDEGDFGFADFDDE